PAVIAERVGVRVVSDFRSRDVAAGGQGAPLVPLADVVLFGHPECGRLLLNIGGIANVTFAPRRGVTGGALAFDTGPGVAVVDAVTRRIDPAAARAIHAWSSSSRPAWPRDPWCRSRPCFSTVKPRRLWCSPSSVFSRCSGRRATCRPPPALGARACSATSLRRDRVARSSRVSRAALAA